MKQKIIEIKNLTFSYNEGENAIDDLSVVLYEKEKVAVLGANGAGKSTFFLHLNGVRIANTGDIFLYNKKIEKKNLNELRKNVGIVFQDADSQIIGDTVKAEVAFGPLNMKLSKDQVEKRTIKAINRMNLNELIHRPPHFLSGGEKKRVSIADILAMETKVIIFDEPTASLDPVHAHMVESILDELGQEGKTILLSTHDVDFAYRFADRVLVFHKGKLIADGNSGEIFANEKLLEKANLKKPMIMQMYELLKDENVLSDSETNPKTLTDIKKLLKRKGDQNEEDKD